jgi:integrase
MLAYAIEPIKGAAMTHKARLGTTTTGIYRRALGRKLDGKKHWFYLGTDQDIARERNLQLEKLWKKCKPAWDEVSLAVAKAIARGENEIEVPDPTDLKGGIARIVQADWRKEIKELGGRIKGDGGLHKAFQEYKEWVKKDKVQVNGNPTEWNIKVCEMVDRFITHHADIPVNDLTLPIVEQMMIYWKNRPDRKGTTIPIAKTTARNQLIQLRSFFKWLARHYDWRYPIELFSLKFRIPETPEEISAKGMPHPVYNLEELTLLFSKASWRMRLMMLLALNCAFKQAEIGTLFKREVQGDYIVRNRQKNKVYGEWKLWPETKLELAKAMADSQLDYAITTETGKTYSSLTTGGNHNQKIQSMWYNLVKVASVKKLGFTSLVDLAVTRVRNIAGGEVASIFKAHGQATSDTLLDNYADRPFIKVFNAIDLLHEEIKHCF